MFPHVQVDLRENGVALDPRHFADELIATADVIAAGRFPEPAIEQRLLEPVPSPDFGARNLALPHVAVECRQGQTQIPRRLPGGENVRRPFGTLNASTLPRHISSP